MSVSYGLIAFLFLLFVFYVFLLRKTRQITDEFIIELQTGKNTAKTLREIFPELAGENDYETIHFVNKEIYAVPEILIRLYIMGRKKIDEMPKAQKDEGQ